MAENRRGTERRVPAARRLSKAADVPKDEVGQGAGPVAAADVEATSLAMRPRALLRLSRLSLVVSVASLG